MLWIDLRVLWIDLYVLLIDLHVLLIDLHVLLIDLRVQFKCCFCSNTNVVSVTSLELHAVVRRKHRSLSVDVYLT